MKGSLSDRVKKFIAEHQGVTEDEILRVFQDRKKAVRAAIYYAKKTGAINEIDGELYYVGRLWMVDKIWKAMRYLRRFKIKHITMLCGWDRRKVGAILTEFVRAGAIKKEIGKNRRDVYYIVLSEERPVLRGGRKYVSRKKQS